MCREGATLVAAFAVDTLADSFFAFGILKTVYSANHLVLVSVQQSNCQLDKFNVVDAGHVNMWKVLIRTYLSLYLSCGFFFIYVKIIEYNYYTVLLLQVLLYDVLNALLVPKETFIFKSRMIT